MQKKVEVAIKGISPLLMHSFPMMPLEHAEKKSKEEQAEYAAYRDAETKELYIPSVCIQRCMVSAATYSKGKGRASLQKQVAACVFISPDRVSLGTKDYKIDARPVVVPATKGRIIRYRPILEQWQCKFEIEYDDDLLTEANLRKILDDGLQRVGLLDFRPEKKGPFGRAIVTKWTAQNGK